MKRAMNCLAAVMALAGLADLGSAQCQTLTTFFAQNNNNSIGGQNFFDLDVLKASGITIDSLDVNCGPNTPLGTNFTCNIYTTPTTHVGKETNAAAWTLVSSGPAVSMATNTPTPVNLADFSLPAGKVGFCVTFVNASLAYTNGTGANQVHSNADITMTCGTATNAPFAGTVFSPRVWNGTIYYDCVNVTKFCTAKAGLVCGAPAISAAGVSSVAATSGVTVSAGPARSDKSGILLYNNAGTTAGVPFQGGTLCVPAMGLRRAGSTNSKGTCGPPDCSGVFTIDMNAFASGNWVVPDCAGNPTATPPNNPAAFLLTAGTQIDVQYWGRDSVATGSFVSDGLSYVQGP